MSPKRPMAEPKISMMRILTKSVESAASARAVPDPTTHTTRQVTQANGQTSTKHLEPWRVMANITKYKRLFSSILRHTNWIFKYPELNISIHTNGVNKTAAKTKERMANILKYLT